ncbi:hypothetical protein PQI64_16455 [Shewanella bicestrii]
MTTRTELLNTLSALSAADPDHYPAVTLDGYFIELYNKNIGLGRCFSIY